MRLIENCRFHRFCKSRSSFWQFLTDVFRLKCLILLVFLSFSGTTSWYQFTQWLDYYGKIWDKAVVAVSPNYTSQDCSFCGHRVKKSLSTRTHSCVNCNGEICRDTNAAINILTKGMKVLGMEWNSGKCGLGVSPSRAIFQDNSTFGQKESASQEEKHGEKTANTIDGQLDIASGLP